MTRRRWIADEVDLQRNRAALTGQNAAHLARVLRVRAGQEFDLVLPGGSTARAARVTAVSNDRVEFELGAELMADAAPRRVSLYLAVFKFDRMEWAIEKATELGVTEIVPVIARRTEKHLAQAAAKRVERWRRIAREAAQQSRSPGVPEVVPPIRLPQAAELAKGARIVLAENESQTMLKDVLQGSEFSLAIGPEGGWTQDELGLFDRSGWRRASLGPNVLRAETAAIAALAVVLCC